MFIMFIMKVRFYNTCNLLYVIHFFIVYTIFIKKSSICLSVFEFHEVFSVLIYNFMKDILQTNANRVRATKQIANIGNISL